MAQNLSIESTLTQQFITMTQGSASATAMNLPNSLVEVFNLYASTALYAKYLPVTNAFNDSIMVFKSASTGYIPGYINPAHLKMSSRFEGTGMVSNAISGSSPIYNSITPAGKMVVNALALPSQFSSFLSAQQFTGGTASGTTVDSPANLFDSSLSTYAVLRTGYYAMYDFGAGNSKTIYRVHFIAYNNAGLGSDSVNTITISGSNDNINFTNLGTTNDSGMLQFVQTIDGTSYYMRVVPILTPASYRYYKFAGAYSSNKQCYAVIGIGIGVGGVLSYDTSIYRLGTSSMSFGGGVEFASGTATAASQQQLGSLDWQMRGFFRFSSAPSVMTLMTILGKELEIQATSTGLRVNYSTNGSSFTTVNSSEISWVTDTWYYISVRRTGNTLFFFVDNVGYGTADLTGVTFYATASTTFYLGADSSGTNMFAGHMDEVEFWVGESITDEPPISPRTTAYIPAISWQSQPVYISSTATEVDVVLFLDVLQYASFGLPTLGTDSHFYISLDGGLTFREVSLAREGSLTLATAIYRGYTDTTGLTNTSQLVYKITSDADKVFKFDGLCIYWQDASDTVTLTAQQVWDYAGNELASVPGSTSSMKDKLAGIFQYFFNKRAVTATAMNLYKTDDTTLLGTSVVTDDSITTTKGKIQ